jgi:DNA-directed RNA polymerase specialized sigma24 family protein
VNATTDSLRTSDVERIRAAARAALRDRAQSLRHEHEDIVSDVVADVWVRLCDQSKEPIRDLEGYVRVVAVRRAGRLAGSLRGQAHHVEVNDEIDQGPTDGTPDVALERRALLGRAVSVLRGDFTPKEQQIYREHRLDGATRAKLADKHGLSLRTLNRRLTAMDRAVAELVDCDEISARERKLLRLYGLGLATRQQRAAIKPAIEADPTCAQFVRDVVETSRGAAALLPSAGAVEVADPGIMERTIAPLARLKERLVGSVSDAAEAGATTAASGGGSRGAGGALGSGVLASVVGGTGAKVAALCAGSAVAAVCASAVGVLPVAVDPFQLNQPAQDRKANEGQESGEPTGEITGGAGASPGAGVYSPSSESGAGRQDSAGDGDGERTAGGGGGSDQDPSSASAELAEPSAVEQEFDPVVPPPSDSASGSGGAGNGGGGAGAGEQTATEKREFGGP